MISSRTWSRPWPDASDVLDAWPEGHAWYFPSEAPMALEAPDGTVSWVGATAKQIARAVRRGDTSAAEVIADHLAHITARGAVVRAFGLLRAGEALAEADAVDAQQELGSLPLAGVPVAVK